MPKTTEIEITYLAIEALKASATNPRKHFDEKELADLASSIKEKGVLEPILVREHVPEKLKGAVKAGQYEIVAGERRYRASKLAGLEKMPCIVRVLTDQETVEIQVVENMQRQDLTPIEEATGYKALVDDFKYTMDDLAAKIGKSKSYINGRFRLLSLSPKVLKALKEGQLKLAMAVEMIRVAKHEDQEELLNQIVSWGDISTAAELREKIERRYMLNLAEAPFNIKDAELVPKAGKCADCPKHTGAQAGLFDDLGKKDVCLDAACWASKVEACNKALVDKYKAEGKQVVQLKRGEGFDAEKRGLVDPDEEDYHLKGEETTYRQALKQHKVDDQVPLTVVVDSKGVVKTFMEKKAVMAALPKKAFEYRPDRSEKDKSASSSGPGRKKRLLDLKATRTAWPAAWKLAIERVSEKPLTGETLKVFVDILVKHIQRYPCDRFIRDRAGIEVKGMLGKAKSELDFRTVMWQVALEGGLSDTRLTEQARKVFNLAKVEWTDLKGKAADEIIRAKLLKDAKKELKK